MATKKMKKGKSSKVKDLIEPVVLDEKMHKEYKDYATAMIEDRFVVGTLDGVKPVLRRALWSAHTQGLHHKAKHEKSAKVVGDTLGKYHPHGDTACYGAIVTAANSPMRTVDGKGNWGTMIDPNEAAMRYCFIAGTRIMSEKGLLRIEELAETKRQLKRVGDYKLTDTIQVDSSKGSNAATYFVNSGDQDVVTVTSKTGFSTTCTPNEPFLVLTPTGHKWKDADRLQVGDWLCIKRNHTTPNMVKSGKKFGQLHASKALASILGYLVGDGFVNKGQNYVGFSQCDKVVYADFTANWELVFPDFKYDTNVRGPNSYGVQDSLYFNCNSVEVKRILASVGLHEGDSYDRCVPESVFSMSKDEVGAFLRTLYECDGSVVTPARGSSTITLTSVSTQLLEDVRLLLLTYFGIISSTIQPDTNCSRIMITGAENVRRYKKDINFVSKRKRSVLYVSKDERGNRDMIPFANLLGASDYYKSTRRSDFRRKFVAGSIEETKVTKAIYSRDYYYDQVVSVEDAGRAMVYDLTVEDAHSFTANGIVVHNTNMRLTKYADLCFFDRFYLPTVEFIPNYDGSQKEPLNLPAMLPNVLLNGNFGIGPGVNTRIPAFTLKSVIKTLRKVIKEGKGVATPELCMGLVPTCETGGHADLSDKDVRKELKQFYKTGVGTLTLWSQATAPDSNNTIRYNRFAPMPENLTNKLDKIAALNGVKSIDDDSEASDPFLVAFKVKLNPTLKGSDRRKTLEQIDAVFSTDYRLDVKVTDRVMNSKGDGASISLRSTNVPTLINDWLAYRISAEKKACKYWSKKRQERIDYLKLLIHAINHLDHIIKALKEDDSHAYLVKHLKITRDQADMILQLRVIQLKRLEIKKLTAEIADLKTEIAGYAERIKKPRSYIYRHLETLWNELKGEAARQESEG